MPRVTADLIAPDDGRWRAVLASARHDVYHLPEYAIAAARQDGGVAAAFYAQSGGCAMLAPLLVRDLEADLGAPAGWKDATSPYGYGGPIATSGTDDTAIGRMLQGFLEVAGRHRFVTAFLRLHPLRGVAHRALESLGTVVRHGPVVYIDLSRSRAELTAETRANHRRNIARLIRSGFDVEVDNWDTFAAFRRLYRMTMQRHGASEYYSFSDEYFDDLRRLLACRLHLFTVRSPSGDIAAAGLFTAVDGMVEYHLGGTDDDYVSRAPSKLMIDFVRWWAKDTGNAVLNLGGGVGASGGPLLHFKTGFSASQARFHSCRVTLDESRYASLVRITRGARHPQDSDYFPEYRRLHHRAHCDTTSSDSRLDHRQ